MVATYDTTDVLAASQATPSHPPQGSLSGFQLLRKLALARPDLKFSSACRSSWRRASCMRPPVTDVHAAGPSNTGSGGAALCNAAVLSHKPGKTDRNMHEHTSAGPSPQVGQGQPLTIPQASRLAVVAIGCWVERRMASCTAAAALRLRARLSPAKHRRE